MARWISGTVTGFAALAVTWTAIAVTRVDPAGAASGEAARVRVGTYDNRAIAVAFAPSKFSDELYHKMKRARDEARESGDEKRVKEVEARAGWLQKKLHFQGFGRAPVGDLMAHIKEKLPEVARKANVDVIAWEYDYTGKNVERVDVTDLLVAQFNPSPKTLKTIEQLTQKKPIPLETLDRTAHDH